MAKEIPKGWSKWHNFYVSNPHTHQCIARIEKKPTIGYEFYESTGQDGTIVRADEVLNVAFGAQLTTLISTQTLRVLPPPPSSSPSPSSPNLLGMQTLCEEINDTWESSYHAYTVKRHSDALTYSAVKSDNLPVIGVVIQVAFATPIWVYVHWEEAERLNLSGLEVACVIYSVHAPHEALKDHSCSGKYTNNLTTQQHELLSPNLVSFLELLRSATLNDYGPNMILPRFINSFDARHLWHPAIELELIPNGSALFINGIKTHVKQDSWQEYKGRQFVLNNYSGVYFMQLDHIVAKKAMLSHSDSSVLPYEYGEAVSESLAMARHVTYWVLLCTTSFKRQTRKLKGGTINDALAFVKKVKTRNSKVESAIEAFQTDPTEANARILVGVFATYNKRQGLDLQFNNELEKVKVDTPSEQPEIASIASSAQVQSTQHVQSAQAQTAPTDSSVETKVTQNGSSLATENDKSRKHKTKTSKLKKAALAIFAVPIATMCALAFAEACDWTGPLKNFFDFASDDPYQDPRQCFLDYNFQGTAFERYITDFSTFWLGKSNNTVLTNSTTHHAFDFDRFGTVPFDNLTLCFTGSCNTVTTVSDIDSFYSRFAAWEHFQAVRSGNHSYVQALKLAVTVHGILNNTVNPNTNRLFINLFRSTENGISLTETLDMWMNLFNTHIDDKHDLSELAVALDKNYFGHLIHEWLVDLTKQECRNCSPFEVMQTWESSWTNVLKASNSTYRFDMSDFESDAEKKLIMKNAETYMPGYFKSVHESGATHPYLTSVRFVLSLDKFYNSVAKNLPSAKVDKELNTTINTMATRAEEYIQKHKNATTLVEDLAEYLYSGYNGPRVHAFMKSNAEPNDVAGYYSVSTNIQAYVKHWNKVWFDTTLTGYTVYGDFVHKVKTVEDMETRLSLARYALLLLRRY